MPGTASIGKLLIVIGAVLVAAGLALTFAGRIPWLGRLPGDIVIERGNYTVYIPVTTAILLSLMLSLVLWLIGRR